MVTHQTTCKFCKKPITVQLDSVGLEFCKNNGMDLLSMAACNRCADLRTLKFSLTDSVVKACALFGQRKTRKPLSEMSAKQKEFSELSRIKFSLLISSYANMIKDWTGREAVATDRALKIMMEFPEQAYDILQHMWPERRTT